MLMYLETLKLICMDAERKLGPDAKVCLQIIDDDIKLCGSGYLNDYSIDDKKGTLFLRS